MKTPLLALGLALVLSVGCSSSSKNAPSVAEAPAPAVAVAPAAVAEATPELDPAGMGKGFLRIAFRLQTQQDVYGFNVYRADSADGPWAQINPEVIPGHGTTALPESYEYFDSGLNIGQKYFYYVTEVTLTGQENEITPKSGAVAKPRSFYVERGQLPAE